MMSDPTHAQDQAAQGQAASGSAAARHGAGVKERLAHEVRLFLFMFLYLFIMIGLFTVYERVVLAQHQIRYAHYGFALVNALVLAKVMLIAEDLHLGHRFENRPIIYPVVIKSVLFAVVFICFRMVEDVLMGLWDGKSFLASIPSLGGGGVAGYLSIGLIMSFALIPFFAFTEVGRVLGPGVLHALMLKHRPADVAVELKLRARGGE